MKNILITLILILGLVSANLYAKAFEYKKIFKNNKGIKEYNKRNYKQAEKDFLDNSIKDPKDPYLHFNLGDAYYKNKQYDKAETEYKYALSNPAFKDKSAVYHNLGNIFFQKKEYKKALENYRKALLENPNNNDARHNYEVVKKLMMKQQKQKQKNKNNKKNKKDKKKNKQKQDKNKQKKNQKKKQQNKQQKKQEKKKQNQQKKSKMQKQQEKKKKEIEKILKALMKKEKQKRKEKQVPAVAPHKGKYW